ncbi:WXG100 family type VII secretion target [Amycolatopsis sp. NBC_00438]|uniref:WXG100 family type VII secretion target n=1 Tax=Amycolatopsis sp. NBC_00438 TaxID=2903558 RepID=UPI002E2371FC
MAEWADIKKVLDDPNVSMEKKSALMEAYDKDTWNFNDEEEKYAKEYIDGYSDRNWATTPLYPTGSDGEVDDRLKEAQQESQAKGKEQQAQTDRKNQAKKNLDGIAKPTLNAGAKSSDEQLDQGNVTVDFLVLWTTDIWNKIKGGTGQLDPQKDLKDKFHENRGIQYQKFLTDADDLAKAHKVVEDTLTKSDTELQTLFGEWKGKGANAAEIKYDETIKPHAKELSQQIDGAAKLLPETVGHVFDAVKKKVDEVLGLHRTTIAQADIGMARDVLKIANGETGEFDDFMKVAGWVDGVNAKNGNQTNLAERLQNDDCGFNDENKEYGRQVCRYWRDGAFTTEYQGLINAFNGSCKSAKDTIDQQWGALDQYLAGYTNQLTEAKGAGPDTGKGDGGKDTSTGGGGKDSNTGGGGPGTGGGGPGTGGGGTGSGGGGTTTPSASEPPKPEDAAPKPGDAGTNPVTGKPLEVDPSTGEPYPIDPKTGEAIKDADDTETVSVKKGDNTIEMSEPDKQGKMDITVDDGQGHKKDYPLDWGDDDKADAKGADGKGADGKDAAFGPQGSQAVKDGQPSADGSYKPGADGKIHIQDGNLKITAERPEGPGGPTVVTVDDGKGEPTTYTLDSKDGPKTGDLKADGTGAASDTGTSGATAGGTGGSDGASSGPDSSSGVASEIQHDANAESPLTKDPSPDNPDPGMTQGAAAAGGGGGFSAPGGMDFSGDLGTDTTAEPALATADAGAGGGGDSTTTAGASDFGSAVTGGHTTADFAGAVSLDPGAQTGSDASLPAADGGGLGATPVDPGAHQAAASGSASGMSGMGGMGGMMGGMGGSPGGGGDQQRGASQYRIEGGVFETSGAKGRISGSLDDEGERSIRYDR